MSEGAAEIYEFEGFRLNVTEHVLVRPDGERLQLSEKAFETLCVLVRNGGHLVKKSDLLDQVWADSFVEENNLNKCVHALRRSLGETNGGTQYIETVKKHGFRFVPDVHRVSENGAGGHNGNGFHPIETAALPSESVPSQAVADQPKAEPPRSRLPIVAIVVVILLGAVALVYFVINRPAPIPEGTRSIAVLPFRPINTANRDELYEVGLAESVIHQLSPINGLVVRPLSAMRGYTEVGQDPVAAGREQKVDHVLASNYQLSEGKFRVTANLINVASGQIEDSFKVEPPAGDAFAIQDFIAAEIGKRIVDRFGATTGSACKRGTSNEEAYRHYLQGMFLYDQRKIEAVERLDQAVALDPNYALAWAGKAHAHYAVAIKNNSDTRREYERSMEAVNRALSLDPMLSEAYSARCMNKFYYEYDFAGAERDCERALELDPNSSIAYLTYNLFLLSRGRYKEAIAAIKTAIDLEPASLFSQGMYANTLYLARRYDEAREQYIRVWERKPDRRPTYEWMIRNLDASGKDEEAFDWFIRLLRLDKIDEQVVERYRNIFKESGWMGVLRERERSDMDDENPLRKAGVNARIGNKERAFELLNQAWERRVTLFGLFRHEAQFDNLRDDPRYAEMVSRIESK